MPSSQRGKPDALPSAVAAAGGAAASVLHLASSKYIVGPSREMLPAQHQP